MGVVHLARQKSLDRLVALKLVRVDLLADPAVLERFRREARAAAKLDHPGAVRVYAYGVDGGQPYYAMEYVKADQ